MHRYFPFRRLAGVLAAGGLVAGALLTGALAASSTGPSDDRAGDAFAHQFTAIEGRPLPLEQFRGRPMLVVNTASFCGFTRQYAELQALWERYRDRGLVVLGVPSNDFAQEMDDNAAIQAFCEVQFGIDFPLTEQVAVRGAASHPLFAEIREVLGQGAGPNWNFFKYLIAADGSVVAGWPSRTAPSDAAIIAAIEEALEPAS